MDASRAKLSAAQLGQYEDQGFVLLHDWLCEREMDVLSREWGRLRTSELPGLVTERDGQSIRTLNGAHQVSEVMRRLCLHPRLVIPARQILGEDIYIHQTKINTKAAFQGDLWQWHQDYIYWQREDGMRQPRALTVAVFLDDSNEFNGPLLFVPGSFRCGVLPTPQKDNALTWHSHVSADLKYALPHETIAALVRERGIVSSKAARGSVLFFHCNVVHGSATNMSPFERKLVLVTFNCVSNAIPPSDHPRPAFLANRDFTPIEPLDHDVLLSLCPSGAEANV